MSAVVLNARFRSRPVTGVERFATEIGDRLARMPDLDLTEVQPKSPVHGLKGHAWEQFSLPSQVPGGSVLFSPCNTGPLAVKRQLIVIHDAAVWDFPEGFSASFRQVYRQLLPRLARRCAGVATVSQFSRERLAHHLWVPEEKIIVLGNAVGEAFRESPSPRSNDSATLLCVGSLDPRKNLSRLVRAWLDLKSRDQLPENARLKIVGGANPRNFAAFDRAEDVSIEWLGRVDDNELIRQYQQAAAFIFPSYYEGFGLPPVEAMACGCPVLLSNQASLPEVGGPDFDPGDPEAEGAALYFDPFSEAEIGQTILHFLELDPDRRARLRANALARSGQFSWDALADRTADALRAIA